MNVNVPICSNVLIVFDELRTIVTINTKRYRVFSSPKRLDGIDGIETRDIVNLLNDYKILFHPIRLSIMVILVKNHKFKSSELRELLGVSWGNYITHLNTLNEANLIDYVNELDKFTQQNRFVYIKHYGLTIFEGFRTLFESVFNNIEEKI